MPTRTDPVASPPYAPPSMTPAADALPRRLGIWAMTAIVIGTIIGSGIFRVPAAVAASAGSVGGVVAVWVLGGIITLCGTLALAELAAAYPQTGGVYVYLREAWGPGTAFVFGWTSLVLAPASTGGIALVFAEYLGQLVPLSPNGVRAAASASVLLATVASYRSVRGVGAIIGAASYLKVGAIAALVVTAFALATGHAGALGAGAPAGTATAGGVGLGLVSALWAYNGMQDAVSIAGEVREPARTIPLALLVGTGIVMAVYLLANAAYLWVLPWTELVASPLVASATMVRVVGASGASLVSAMVMVSTFGATAGLVLVYPRLFFAMAREGLLFASLGRVHPRYETPHVAVVAFGVVSAAATWSSTFDQLSQAFVLGIWPFLALAVAGLWIVRRRPGVERPYRTPLYPIVPLVFILGTLGVVVSALVAQPVTTLAGIGLTLLGVPLYLVQRRTAGAR